MTRTFIIGGRVYEVQSPTIKNIALASEVLKELPEKESIQATFNELDKERLSKALSFLSQVDAKELSKGSKEELVDALTTLYEDIMPSFNVLSTMSNALSHLVSK